MSPLSNACLRRAPFGANRLFRIVGPAFAALSALVATTGSGGDAAANGETRTIEIYHTHTRESATITYKRNGSFDAAGLEKLNWVLRDWRRDEPTRMDPRLFDIVWEVRREVGSEEPLHVVSAYRAPETNAMLRRRSKAVAEHSQHMAGKAMDFYLPDVPMGKVREIALRLQRGGVGYYPTSYNPFVHLDAGSIRHWPRMTRDQLARVFPDGKTVHVPTDGKPMPRYEEALAEVEATGGVVSSYADAGDSIFSNRRGKSFFAALFGSRDEEDDEAEARPRGRLARAPSRGQQVASAPSSQLAYAPATFNGEGDRPAPYFPNTTISPTRAVVRPTPQPERTAQPEPERTPQPVVVAARSEPTQQFVWSQGAAASARASAMPAVLAPQPALVPVPMPRPVELTPPSVLLANVPLPPARPVLLASATPMLPASLAQTQPETTASINATLTPAAVAAAVPLPPARPSAFGGAKIAVAPPAAALDRNGLNWLFTHARTDTTPAQSARVAVSPTRARVADKSIATHTAQPQQAVAMRFESRPSSELSTDRFAGPAVKPLPVARFTP